MKQFSAKEYLANPSRKVITRDGRPVRVLCTDKKSEYSVVALVSQDENTETTYHFAKDGTHLKGEESDIDLFFEPVKYKGWVNVYMESDGTRKHASTTIYDTKEKAMQHHTDCCDYVETVPIEWEA